MAWLHGFAWPADGVERNRSRTFGYGLGTTRRATRRAGRLRRSLFSGRVRRFPRGWRVGSTSRRRHGRGHLTRCHGGSVLARSCPSRGARGRELPPQRYLGPCGRRGARREVLERARALTPPALLDSERLERWRLPLPATQGGGGSRVSERPMIAESAEVGAATLAGRSPVETRATRDDESAESQAEAGSNLLPLLGFKRRARQSDTPVAAASARRDGGGVSFPSPRPQTRARPHLIRHRRRTGSFAPGLDSALGASKAFGHGSARNRSPGASVLQREPGTATWLAPAAPLSGHRERRERTRPPGSFVSRASHEVPGSNGWSCPEEAN